MLRKLRQPHAALVDLCDGFFDDLSFLEQCPQVAPDAMPPVARKLLVHREHMTCVLSEHYGRPVRLNVLVLDRDGDHYARKIVLTLAGEEKIVEFGIVRLDFRYMPAAVRHEIEARDTPLGDVLIRHGVMRRISPRWYFEFPAGTPIAAALGRPDEPAFGRVGTIFCDEEPAIDLLEVVA